MAAFKMDGYRPATHNDFEFGKVTCAGNKGAHESSISEVAGGWLIPHFSAGGDSMSESMCFVPFPEKYVLIEKG